MNTENAATDARHATWADMVWQQFGAAIDMFDNTLAACPDELWTGRLWSAEEGPHRELLDSLQHRDWDPRHYRFAIRALLEELDLPRRGE